jgi:hypothetical protein
VPVDLGDTVGAARVERRRLLLRRLLHLAEHLAARRLVEANAARIQQPDGFEDARHADGGEFPGQHRLLPTRRHEAHGGEVVDLVGFDVAQHVDDRQLVEQVRLVQGDAVAEVSDALEVLGAGPADHAVYLIALVQQPFGEVTAVLTRDAGNDGFFHCIHP